MKLNKRCNLSNFTIIDNFLNVKLFDNLSKLFMGNDINWHYNRSVNGFDLSSEENLNDFQFTHTIFKDHIIYSQAFTHLEPILKLLDVKSLIRIKANLTTKTDVIYEHGMHVDTIYDCHGAIMYINTNNGYTKIGEEKVQSVANRLVRFNPRIPHTGSTSTDSQTRVVLNFNFF